MRLTIAYSKIKKRNLVLINNDTHQRETLSERPIRPPLNNFADSRCSSDKKITISFSLWWHLELAISYWKWYKMLSILTAKKYFRSFNACSCTTRNVTILTKCLFEFVLFVAVSLSLVLNGVVTNVIKLLVGR